MKRDVAWIAITLLLGGFSAAYPKGSGGNLTITIAYDNTTYAPGTTADWGFSCFIQTADDTILFDGGTFGTILKTNAEALGIDLSSAKRVFLSHDHADHAGGLPDALALTPGLPVYLGASFSASVINAMTSAGGTPVFVTGPVRVSEGCYSTGQLPSSIGAYEHSLVIDTDSGLVVVVGCSHPGIVDMLRTVKGGLGREIFAVFGGFHLLDLSTSQLEEVIGELKDLGVRKCGATHCTGVTAIQMISDAYGSDFLPMGVGRVLQFSAFNVPTGLPVMWLSAGEIDFGPQEIGGTQDTATLTVENLGQDLLTISEISHSTSAFELIDLPQMPATIQSGMQLQIRALFHPQAAATYGDTLRIASNDPASPVRALPLKGQGIVIEAASVNTLYALGGETDAGTLWVVNPATGATRLIGPSGCGLIIGGTVCPRSGDIIGLAQLGSSTLMARLSAVGKCYAPVLQLTGTAWRAMAFREDTLYLTRSATLYRVDMNSGTLTLVRVFSGRVFSGLTYRSTRDDFLATVGGTGTVADSLYRVDPHDWTMTAVGPLGMSPVVGIMIDDAERLYGILSEGTSESALLRIDPETGGATRVGPMGSSGLTALAGLGIVTDVGIADPVLPGYLLLQSYPNPFNPTTTITYCLPERSQMALVVFNPLGQRVTTLVQGQQEAGRYDVVFDGSGLSSGVYLYRLRAGDFVQTRKLVLLR